MFNIDVRAPRHVCTYYRKSSEEKSDVRAKTRTISKFPTGCLGRGKFVEFPNSSNFPRTSRPLEILSMHYSHVCMYTALTAPNFNFSGTLRYGLRPLPVEGKICDFFGNSRPSRTQKTWEKIISGLSRPENPCFFPGNLVNAKKLSRRLME